MTLTARILAAMTLAAGIVPLFPAEPPQSNRAATMQGVTDLDYIYKGQAFQMRLMRGQLFMVLHDGMPLVMYMNGTAHPLGQDAGAVALAEEAVKAYQAGTPSGGVAASSTGTPTGSGLTVDGVISLLQAGLSEDLVIMKIRQSDQAFNLSTDDMLRLKKAGTSDAVMKAMMSAPAATPVSGTAVAASASPPVETEAPNPVAEDPKMGKLAKESFFSSIGHSTTRTLQGKSVIDRLSMRNILPQWDPGKRLDQQYPHIAITVLYAPAGWMDDYRMAVQKNNRLAPPCFHLKAVVWLDATRSKTTDEFQWCIDHDMFMSELQPTYLASLRPVRSDYGQTSGIERTDGPKPPDKLLPSDRTTLDMEAKTNPHGAAPDLNMEQNSMFALMFANIRKDLGETLNADGDYRVWITSIKKASGPSIF